MKTAKAAFGPWPNGIDNIHESSNVEVDQFGKPQSVLDALNINFSFSGFPSTRKGAAPRIAMPGSHSIKTTSVGTYFVYNGDVYKLTNDNGYEATLIGALADNQPASFDNYYGGVIVSSLSSLKRITAAGLFEATVPDGVAVSATVTSNGGMHEGKHGIACAFIDQFGQEGALPLIQWYDVPEGGGISVLLPSATGAVAVRVFITRANGKVLGRALDGAPGAIVLLGGDLGDGKEPVVAPELQARAMPSGEFVVNWLGRTLTARGRFLYHSEPYAPHLNSKTRGFTQFPRKINFVAGVREGVFVGTREDVFFMAGRRPEEWQMISTGGQPAAARGAVVVDGNALDSAYKLAGQDVAVWLSTTGFVFGLPGGSIIQPQARRFKTALPQKASIAIDDANRRIVAITG